MNPKKHATTQRVQTVMGHCIKEPRITARAVLLFFACVVLPVFFLGTLADLLLEVLLGICSGLWCF